MGMNQRPEPLCHQTQFSIGIPYTTSLYKQEPLQFSSWFIPDVSFIKALLVPLVVIFLNKCKWLSNYELIDVRRHWIVLLAATLIYLSIQWGTLGSFVKVSCNAIRQVDWTSPVRSKYLWRRSRPWGVRPVRMNAFRSPAAIRVSVSFVKNSTSCSSGKKIRAKAIRSFTAMPFSFCQTEWIPRHSNAFFFFHDLGKD